MELRRALVRLLTFIKGDRGAATAPLRAAPRPAPTSTSSSSANQGLNLPQVKAVRDALAEKLWSVVFGASTVASPPVDEKQAAREAILTALASPASNPRHLPRRPQLLTRLVVALRDPNSTGEHLAKIIGQDPVLSADVLRLANSPLYRRSPAPVESIQRAIAVCGGEGLQALVTTAIMRPMFKATSKNFPLFTAVLWERSEYAARAAEIYAGDIRREDRFEAQLLALLSALGPLAVYRVLTDFYISRARATPNPAIFKSLIREFSAAMASRVAAHWDTPPRLLAALTGDTGDSLEAALYMGELLSTMSLLESRSEFNLGESLDYVRRAQIPEAQFVHLQKRLIGPATAAKRAAPVSSPAAVPAQAVPAGGD